jgi:hypothetical protein
MKRFFAYMLSAVLLCASCTEALVFDPGTLPVRSFVVDGMVTDQLCHQTVRLSMTEGFFSESAQRPWVSGARVTVTCGERIYEYAEDPAAPGTYRSVDEFRGETGLTYKLDVEAEVDGKLSHYQARDSVPQIGCQLDSIDYIYSKDMDNLWTLAIWGKDFYKMRSRYLIQVAINGHFKPLEKSVEIPDDHFDGMTFTRFTLSALHHTQELWKAYGESFKPLERGDVITMRVSSLSEGYGGFLAKYTHFIFGTVPLLTDQPANLPTNVTGPGPVVGYFGACAIVEAACTVDDPYRTEFPETD